MTTRYHHNDLASEKGQDAYRETAARFQELARETPRRMQAFAEKSIVQTRELYERSKDAFEGVVDSWERSYDAANQGTVAFNRKLIEIAQRNINSGFDLAKSLATAKNFAEIMELQAAYWRKQLGTLAAQAEEVRALSTRVTADVAEPLKERAERGMNQIRKVT